MDVILVCVWTRVFWGILLEVGDCIAWNGGIVLSYDRTDRIGEEIRKVLDRTIREDLKDPRIDGTYSITHVDVTRDLRYAKVRVSVMEEDKRAPMLKALKSGAGYMRRILGQELSLRYTPELLFELDLNIEYGLHIASILREVLPEGAAETEASDGEGAADDAD